MHSKDRNGLVSKLVLHCVSKEFYQGSNCLRILDAISVEFEQGHSYAIVGASGSGKSTLLHIAGALDVPTSGRVELNGVNVHGLSGSGRERLLTTQLGFIFQFHYLINELTVLENVMLPALIKKETSTVAAQRARFLLSSLGIADKENALPTYLSGGEQQRVSIARALCNKPSFIIADEPTGNLDEKRAREVIELLVSAQKEWGMGLILCSHDPRVFEAMDVIYALHNGALNLQNSKNRLI